MLILAQNIFCQSKIAFSHNMLITFMIYAGPGLLIGYIAVVPKLFWLAVPFENLYSRRRNEAKIFKFQVLTKKCI